MSAIKSIQRVRFDALAIAATEFSEKMAGPALHWRPWKINTQKRNNRLVSFIIQSDVNTDFRLHFYNHADDLYNNNVRSNGYFGYLDFAGANAVAGAEQSGGAGATVYHYYQRAPGEGIEVFVEQPITDKSIGILVENTGGIDAGQVLVTVVFEMMSGA